MQTPLPSAICTRSLSGHSLIMPPLSGILPTRCTIPPLSRSRTLQPESPPVVGPGIPTPNPQRRNWVGLYSTTEGLFRRSASTGGLSVAPQSSLPPPLRKIRTNQVPQELVPSPLSFVCTSHHRSSFTINVIDKWNSTSEHIVSTTSNRNFKLLQKNIISISNSHFFLHFFISSIPCFVFVFVFKVS